MKQDRNIIVSIFKNDDMNARKAVILSQIARMIEKNIVQGASDGKYKL